MRVKEAEAIDLKLVVLSIYPLNLIVPNKLTPKTVYRKIKSINNAPTLAKAGSVTRNVSNIILKLFCFLNILNILAILKALITVAEDPVETSVKADTNIPIPVPITTIKSNIFQLSLKYLPPKPIIFIIASTANIPAKMLFSIEVTFSTTSGYPYQEIIRTIVLIIMHMRINTSNLCDMLIL